VSWEKDLEELKKRAELAKEMGGIERIAKHYARGRLTVRERIDQLLDKDSFHETGEIPERSPMMKMEKSKSLPRQTLSLEEERLMEEKLLLQVMILPSEEGPQMLE